MRELKDSDLYLRYLNHDNVIYGRMYKIGTGREETLVVLNDMLIDEIIRKIVNNKKEKTVSEMGNAVSSGKLLLFTTAPDKKMPDMVPFFVGRDRNTGKQFAFVNMYPIVRPIKNADNSVSYELGDANKAYTTLYSAFLAVDKFHGTRGVSPALLSNGAILWADMFNKPLYDAFGMSNPERNEALTYFAIRFFLTYMMECPADQVDSISRHYIHEKKNDLILYMEDQIERKQLNIYSGLIPYMEAIFNDEISQVKGIRVANISNQMNVSFYLQKFVGTYSSNALLGLCTFPYFVYTIVSAMGKSKMVKDKSFDRIFTMHKSQANSFLTGLSK